MSRDFFAKLFFENKRKFRENTEGNLGNNYKILTFPKSYYKKMAELSKQRDHFSENISFRWNICLVGKIFGSAKIWCILPKFYFCAKFSLKRKEICRFRVNGFVRIFAKMTLREIPKKSTEFCTFANSYKLPIPHWYHGQYSSLPLRSLSLSSSCPVSDVLNKFEGR